SPGWGKLHGPLNEMTSALLQWRPGETFKGKTLFWRLVEAYSQLGEGEASIQFNRGAYYFSGDIARHLHDVLGYYLRMEYAVRAVRTGHLGILLQGFEANYSQLVRETGGLVFADLPRLLVDHLRGEACQIGASLLQYRLDTRIDHWLLDEFQDTSRLQWNVLSGFIDEAVQAGSAERSFFYVGDVKQSIYGWRGGDSRLFDDIRDRYAEVIQTLPLNESFRSCPSVIRYVNRIFANLKRVEALPKAVRDRWQSNWEEHTVAKHLRDQSGFAGLLEVVEASTVEDGCIELLRKVNPVARKLSCAILLRNNRRVGEMTAALRAAGIPASMEGETTIVSDNAAGLWLLSLLGRLARPQEGLPRQMPATMALPGLMGALSDTLEAVRMALSRGRYAEATGVAMKAVAEAGLAGDFIQLRIFQLIEAARQFEEGENPSLEGFIQYLLQFKVRESSNSRAVQVMTVHKSKGLDFDIVLLAGFGSETLIRPDYSGLKEKRDAKREVEWIFTFPKKELVLVDPALRPVLQQREADDLFEATCLLYVAMTRAKRGFYAICKPDNKTHSAAVWLDLFAAGSQTAEELAENLPVMESLEFKQTEGKFGWFAEPKNAIKEPSGKLPARLAMAPSGVHFAPRRPLQRRPSPSGVAHALQGRGPSIPSAAGRRFGSDVHLFLSRFQWIDFSDPAALQAIIDGAAAPLRPRLAAFFETPLAREVFASPPAGVVEVWRERPYALKHDGYLTNGIMDRVHLWRDGGRATKAIIYDFKTDALDPARSPEEQLLERYAPQLDLYREALSQLEGMPIATVAGRLVPV
ncbi:MAG: ATP-dependent helicase/nuclease subunit, partial [Verrucomicrobiota bacterium]